MREYGQRKIMAVVSKYSEYMRREWEETAVDIMTCVAN